MRELTVRCGGGIVRRNPSRSDVRARALLRQLVLCTRPHACLAVPMAPGWVAKLADADGSC